MNTSDMQTIVSQEQAGLVVSYFGQTVSVEDQEGKIFQCILRRNQELPVVGDKVIWQKNTEETGTVLKIILRVSLLAKGDNRNKMKPIAANIDLVIIVMAPPPIFSEYLIDRYLIAAELLNIQAMVVLNKKDLLNDSTQAAAYSRMEIYQKAGYQIDFTSIFYKDGLQKLTQTLSGKAGVLLGPSGVGKSSIIAELSQSNAIRIGDVSTKGSGKHTTTATRLYHLPQGGSLIDSPGVREFSLWHVSKKEVLQGFREFSDFKGQCKFRDCSHLVEPGCALQKAVQEGKINTQRFENYKALMSEAE